MLNNLYWVRFLEYFLSVSCLNTTWAGSSAGSSSGLKILVSSVQFRPQPPQNAGIAQQGEPLPYKQGVTGPSPVIRTRQIALRFENYAFGKKLKQQSEVLYEYCF